MLVIMGLISVAVSCYCGYMTVIFAKAAKTALPSMRNAQLWQAEQ